LGANVRKDGALVTRKKHLLRKKTKKKKQACPALKTCINIQTFSVLSATFFQLYLSFNSSLKVAGFTTSYRIMCMALDTAMTRSEIDGPVMWWLAWGGPKSAYAPFLR
jgi:hypothetical protein